MNFKKNFKRFFTLSRSAEGFTLVELIVVIAILGILTSVAVPAYSTYIKSAGESVDEQNLAVMNNAFAVACAYHGVSPADAGFTDSDIDWRGDGANEFYGFKNGAQPAAQTYSVRQSGAADTSAKDDIASEFNSSLSLPIVFKTYNSSNIKLVNGVFIGPKTITEDFQTVLGNLLGDNNKQNITNLMNSIWGEVGAEGLTTKVDWTADIADAMLAMNPDGKFADMILNCGDAMMEYMGITDDAAKAAKIKELALAKMAQLQKENPEKYGSMDLESIYNRVMDPENVDGLTDAEQELVTNANNAISVNNAILAAAKNAQSASTGIKDILLSETPKTDLINSVNAGMNAENPDTGEAMGQAALAYAMYLSYAERNNIEVTGTNQVLDGLNDPNFKAYVNNTDGGDDEFAIDMSGYLSSMDMINNSVQGNEGAVTEVVMNGFGNTQLINVLTQAMNSAKTGN